MRNTAIISESSPRCAEWLKVFESVEVPIINIMIPNKANVLGEIRDVYVGLGEVDARADEAPQGSHRREIWCVDGGDRTRPAEAWRADFG